MKGIEAVGSSFDLNLFEKARDLAWQNLSECVNLLNEGDTEEIAQEKIRNHFAQNLPQFEKWWHPLKVRFGKNTLCSFRDISQEGIALEEGMIFFIDMGPVFDNHEADVGQTYLFGNHSFTNPAENIFNQLKSLWINKSLTGHALYQEAVKLSEEQGLTFNLKMAGHRLSDFPHALHHKGSLKDVDFRPEEKKWVLEVHVLDEKRNVGYFFEDLL